jgi:hypothetical protein
VFLARGGAIGSADRVAVRDRTLILEDGVIAAAGEHPWTLTFGRWRAPLTADRRRVELSERSPGELAANIARTESDGRDASYERSVLYKRWLHPLAVAVFPAAILPLGVRRSPLVWLGLVAIAYLVAVRIGDQLATTIGPWGAAAAGPLWVAAVGAFAWSTWRDR